MSEATMIPQSTPELLGFYEAYLSWYEAGCHTDPNRLVSKYTFDCFHGLCANLHRYADVSGMSETKRIDAGDCMRNQFMDAGLHPTYPFELRYEYVACEDKTMNPLRINWVRDRIMESDAYQSMLREFSAFCKAYIRFASNGDQPCDYFVFRRDNGLCMQWKRWNDGNKYRYMCGSFITRLFESENMDRHYPFNDGSAPAYLNEWTKHKNPDRIAFAQKYADMF